MRIPNWPVAGEREIELLREVLDHPQWGGYNPMVARFEEQFAALQSVQHCISAVNGTVTLELLLTAAGIGAGDEVIVPAISFVATATAVSRVGATPVFVDIEPHSFNMDPACAERAITAKTKAIIAVHFGGPLADMDRLVPLAEAHKLILVEDAAHSQGAEWRGRGAGSIGWAGSFSFQNGKVLTAGEGGAMTTNSSDVAVKLRSLCNIGRKAGENFFYHYALGTNARMTGLQAAVLVGQLERFGRQVALRVRNAASIINAASGKRGLTWQHVPEQVTANSWYLMLGRVDASYGRSRNQLHKDLTAQGIPCTPFYPHPLYRNPLYLHGGCRVEPCPNSEACIEDAFWLPHRVLMADEESTREIAAAF